MASSVSIVIPVFNDQAGIVRCLDALRTQTFMPALFEVIVVDNGSDPALALMETYPFSFRVLACSEPGSYAARNAGARAAIGQVLAFTDADCRPTPQWLAAGVAELTSHRDGVIIGGDVRIVRPNRPSASALYQCVTGFGQADNVSRSGFAATANMLCMRAQFDQVGPFDERLLSGGDREWCWRAARQGISVIYVPKAAVDTDPRSDLRGAIRQARRVEAGRVLLRDLGLANVDNRAVSHRRAPAEAIAWILSDRRLSVLDRIRVLAAACAIRIASGFERVRLAFGAHAERR